VIGDLETDQLVTYPEEPRMAAGRLGLDFKRARSITLES
jgi:hypothetical protein